LKWSPGPSKPSDYGELYRLVESAELSEAGKDEEIGLNEEW
jgi:anthranilate/para-aminobenzoate synthase component II